jgi:hypothetical protein
MTREDRAHELRQLRQTEAHRLIALYRDATGQDELHPLPAGVSISSMIDAIIAHEIESGKLQDQPPHAAGAA